MTSKYENQSGALQDFYEVIGVSQEATSSEIRKAYYKLSRKWHPDKNGGCPEATKKFQTLSEAYETNKVRTRISTKAKPIEETKSANHCALTSERRW